MDIFDRLKRIRVYRQLRQKDIADWYGISVQSWGNKERGKEGGFGLAEIKLFLEKANIDPRYLFGAIENIEDADLLRTESEEHSLTKELIKEVREYRKRNKPLKELDPLADRVISDSALRDLVKRLLNHRGHFSRIHGYIDRLEDENQE